MLLLRRGTIRQKALTTSGYRCIDKARPRPNKDLNNSRIMAVCVCSTNPASWLVKLIYHLTNNTTEVMAVYLHGASVKIVVVVLYRPGSVSAPPAFVDDFANIIERTVLYAVSTVILDGIRYDTVDLLAPKR